MYDIVFMFDFRMNDILFKGLTQNGWYSVKINSRMNIMLRFNSRVNYVV